MGNSIESFILMKNDIQQKLLQMKTMIIDLDDDFEFATSPDTTSRTQKELLSFISRDLKKFRDGTLQQSDLKYWNVVYHAIKADRLVHVSSDILSVNEWKRFWMDDDLNDLIPPKPEDIFGL